MQTANPSGLTFNNALATAINTYASIEKIKRQSDLVDLQIERDRLNLAALSANQSQSLTTPTFQNKVTPVTPSANVEVAGVSINKYVLGGSVVLLAIAGIAAALNN